jgi:hypothetical protein
MEGREVSETEEDPRVIKDDLGMMKRADLWPTWPHLPVKRPRWETGVLIENGATKIAIPTVYQRDGKILAKYDSLEQLVADGWVVD